MFNDFWYDKELFTTNKINSKNEIGQQLIMYKKDLSFIGDIQPIEAISKKELWGTDTQSTIQLFTNKDLEVNDIVVYNEKAYSIEKKIDWIDYKIYALLLKEGLNIG